MEGFLVEPKKLNTQSAVLEKVSNRLNTYENKLDKIAQNIASIGSGGLGSVSSIVRELSKELGVYKKSSEKLSTTTFQAERSSNAGNANIEAESYLLRNSTQTDLFFGLVKYKTEGSVLSKSALVNGGAGLAYNGRIAPYAGGEAKVEQQAANAEAGATNGAMLNAGTSVKADIGAYVAKADVTSGITAFGVDFNITKGVEYLENKA